MSTPYLPSFLSAILFVHLFYYSGSALAIPGLVLKLKIK
nr:MAG TPA: hypothetical protein [Caudoviricetes sp.]